MSAVEKVLAEHAPDGIGECVCSDYYLDVSYAAHVAAALSAAGCLRDDREPMPLTEVEREVLGHADRTIRNAHRLDTHAATLRVGSGGWTTVVDYVERIFAARLTARDDREGETVAAGLRRLADDTDLLYDVVRIALLALADHLSPVTPDGGDQ